MENKKVFQIAIAIALGFLCVLGVTNLINSSNNLKESQKLLENVMKEVSESKEIIKKQEKTINDLQEMNRELSDKIKQVDSTNSLIKSNLDNNFSRTNRTINDIKRTVDDIKTIDIH